MSDPGRIHAAPLTSPRLQRVLRVLSDGRPHTTRGICRAAHVVAVSAVVAELRAHGAEILCVREGGKAPRHRYTMIKEPKTQ